MIGLSITADISSNFKKFFSAIKTRRTHCEFTAGAKSAICYCVFECSVCVCDSCVDVGCDV